MKLLKEIKYFIKFNISKRLRSHLKAKELKLIQDHTDKVGCNDILLFCCLRNEKERMPYFLKYYRNLGVRHFFFVDNDSDDDFLDYMRDQKDCTIYSTTGSYRKSSFGMDWLNFILNKHGTKHWCVTCDPDEFLVFPHCETRNLYELTEYMIGEGQNSLLTVMLDMYSDKPIEQSIYNEGMNPLDICPYFDRLGYFQNQNYYHRGAFIFGGVRLRKIFDSIPERAPCLNKIPLVYWRKGYLYQSSMHWLTPRKLNRMHRKNNRLNITGALLHFKFFSSLKDKAAEEELRKQHFRQGSEYQVYLNTEYKNDFMSDITEKYQSSQQLIDLDLIKQSAWF